MHILKHAPDLCNNVLSAGSTATVQSEYSCQAEVHGVSHTLKRLSAWLAWTWPLGGVSAQIHGVVCLATFGSR